MVELELLDYQFPDDGTDEWDSNWLMVSVRVQTPAARWEACDPCLVTMEVHDLANWMADQVLGKCGPDRIFFLEPNLSLECVGRGRDGFHLRFYFAAECLPPGTPWRDEEFFIPMRVSLDTLRDAANQLCREIRRFPVRANARLRCPECQEI